MGWINHQQSLGDVLAMGFDSFRLVPWFGSRGSYWFRVAFLKSSIGSWLLKLGYSWRIIPELVTCKWFIKHGDRLLLPTDRVVGPFPNGHSWLINGCGTLTPGSPSSKLGVFSPWALLA